MWLAKAFFEYRFRDVAFYVTVITAYLLGVGTFRRAELSWKNDALNGFFAPIVAGGLILSDFLTFKDPAARWIPALILSFCWAIINGVGSEVTGNLVFVVTGAFVSVTTYFSLNDLSVNLFQSLFHYLRLENKKFSTFVNDVDGNLSRLAYRT